MPRQKISKDILELNKNIDEMDLTDIQSILPYNRVHILLSSPWNRLQKRVYLIS
jgi:hypothetical protein